VESWAGNEGAGRSAQSLRAECPGTSLGSASNFKYLAGFSRRRLGASPTFLRQPNATSRRWRPSSYA
jgi:hypothetical protein